MTAKPISFATQIVQLGSTATDLTANTTLLPWPPNTSDHVAGATIAAADQHDYSEREIFLQVIAGSAKFRESDAAPASLDADGHLLSKGDGVVIRIKRRAIGVDLGFWIWRAEDPTKIAISPAAPSPTRDATYDERIEAA